MLSCPYAKVVAVNCSVLSSASSLFLSYQSYVIVKLMLSTLSVSSTAVTSYHSCHLSKFVTINSKAITAVSIRLISSCQIMVISVTSSTVMSSTRHQSSQHISSCYRSVHWVSCTCDCLNFIFGCICITVFSFISTQSSHTTCTFKTLTVCVLSLYHKYCIRTASCTTVCITILQYLSLHTMH